MKTKNDPEVLGFFTFLLSWIDTFWSSHTHILCVIPIYGIECDLRNVNLKRDI